jgi:RNA-directed DNA polymerase
MDYQLYWKLRRWAKRRHPNKGEHWINKYWCPIANRNWVFATRSNNNPITLVEHGSIKNHVHKKVKGDASPYDGNLIYWSSRMGKHPEMPMRTASLLQKQRGKCAHCGLYFKDGDLIELDHIIPKSKGGKDEYINWQLLHRHCHDEKSRTDGSYARTDIPESYQWMDDVLVMY